MKPKKIESPEVLWQHFLDYVEYERKNPLYKREYVGRNGQEVDTPLQVPITFEGFECYLWDLGIISHLSDYSANTNGNYDEYSTIITRIKQNCFVHNFKGASVGVFNHNIIARKLGLIDKQETKHEGEIVIFKGINLDVPTDDSAE
jgi:hypothetical protein